MAEDSWAELWKRQPSGNENRLVESDWLLEVKAEGDILQEKADRLDELLVIYKRHYGNVIEYAIELQKKADLWDQYAIYDNDKEAEIPVKDLITAYEKLKVIKTRIAKYEKLVTLPDPADIDLIDDIKKIMEGEV